MNIFSDILQKALEAKNLVELIVAIAQDLDDSYNPKPTPTPAPVIPVTPDIPKYDPIPTPSPTPVTPEPQPEQRPEQPEQPEEPEPKQPEPTEDDPTADILYFPVGDTSTVDIIYLHPALQKALASGLKICKQSGYDVIVCETYRTPQRQEKLYAQGRTERGSIVTQAKAYQSFHNYGLAVDLMLKDGSAITEEIANIFEKQGFEWGGKWKSFKDYPHFQMSFGRTISEIQDLYQKGGMEQVWLIEYLTEA